MAKLPSGRSVAKVPSEEESPAREDRVYGSLVVGKTPLDTWLLDCLNTYIGVHTEHGINPQRSDHLEAVARLLCHILAYEPNEGQASKEMMAIAINLPAMVMEARVALLKIRPPEGNA